MKFLIQCSVCECIGCFPQMAAPKTVTGSVASLIHERQRKKRIKRGKPGRKETKGGERKQDWRTERQRSSRKNEEIEDRGRRSEGRKKESVKDEQNENDLFCRLICECIVFFVFFSWEP